MRYLFKIAPVFGRFLAVGLSGTLVNLAVLWLLVNLGLPHFPAAVIATEVSIINNFIWNDYWTFRAVRSQSSLISRFGRFQVVTALTAVLTLGLFALLSNNLRMYYLLAQLIAIGIATLVNFAINSQVTWRGLVAGEAMTAVSLPLERVEKTVEKAVMKAVKETD